MNLTLNPKQFRDAFPFFIACSPDLRVVECGGSIGRLIPELLKKGPLEDSVRVERPHIRPLTFEALRKREGKSMLLKSVSSSLQLHGGFLWMEKQEVLTFIGTPILSTATDMEKLGLSPYDFAAHDPVVDLLVAVSGQKVMQEDLAAANNRLKKLAEELTVARDQALEAGKAKSQMMATLSHEIRTPMNGVILAADLLSGSAIQDEERQLVETLRESAQSLLMLVNDILDLSKIEAGKLGLVTSPFQPLDVVDDLVRLFRLTAASKGLRLECEVESDLPPAVMGDPGRLAQIVMNLIGNAVKFTEQGSVVVRVRYESGWIYISVTDTGAGIPKAKQDRLFKAFSQIDGSSTRRHGGTGLGLSICREVAQLWGGNIDVASEEGQGSVFTVRLPVPPVDPKSVPVCPCRVVLDCEQEIETQIRRRIACLGVDVNVVNASDAAAAEPGLLILSPKRVLYHLDTPAKRVLVHARETFDRALLPDGWDLLSDPISQRSLRDALHCASGRRAAELAKPAKPLRVLLAEDNAVNQKLIVRVLAKEGVECHVAHNGQDAVTQAAKTTYDAILMDVQMPVMDGLEATQRIRGTGGELGAIPIIGLTANALAGDRERCLDAGMDRFLSKPVNTQQLLSLLREVTGSDSKLACSTDLDSIPTPNR